MFSLKKKLIFIEINQLQKTLDQKQKNIKEMVDLTQSLTEKITIKSQEEKETENQGKKEEILSELRLLIKESEEIRNRIKIANGEILTINQEILKKVDLIKEAVFYLFFFGDIIIYFIS